MPKQKPTGGLETAATFYYHNTFGAATLRSIAKGARFFKEKIWTYFGLKGRFSFPEASG
jgi:hypothetical protein